MRDSTYALFFILTVIAFPQSAGFQSARIAQRPQRLASKVYVNNGPPSDTFETIVVSKEALPAGPQQDLFYVDPAMEQSMESLKVAGVVAFSTIFGGLVLTHTDSGVFQHSMHTIQHVVQGWGSQAWKSYEDALSSNPICTKAATSATVYSIGDIIAQRSEDNDDGLDLLRVARSGLAGGIGHGPLSHVWYNLSENFFNNVVHLTAWWSFLPKIAVDQTVWGPIWNASYIFLLGLMKQDAAGKMIDDAVTSTIPLFLDGLKLWPLAHVVTYGLIPVENRLLWVDLVEILWVTILASKASSLSQEKTHKESFET